MTDPNTPTDGSEPSGDGSGTESPNVRRLREQYEALKQENEALSAVAKQAAFEKAGLDPMTGIGKAAYQLYSGDLNPSAIAEFAATEYGWEKPSAPPVTPAQQRMDAVGESSTPSSDAKSLLAQAAELEAKGDWKGAALLKDRHLTTLARKMNSYG